MSAAQMKPMAPSGESLERAKELSIRSELGESLLHGGVPVEIFSKILVDIALEFDAIRRERDEAARLKAQLAEAHAVLRKLAEWQHEGKDPGHVAMHPFTQCPHHQCKKASAALSAPAKEGE